MNSRRDFLKRSSALPVAAAMLGLFHSSPAGAQARRRFEPRPQGWRTFEVTTRVEIDESRGVTQVWLPVPSIQSDWQQSMESTFSSNGQARLVTDDNSGARMLHARFAPRDGNPVVAVTSRVKTRDRAVDWARPAMEQEPAALKVWLRPTAWIPTEGIVHSTALEATRDGGDDVARARAIYEWVVRNTYRDPAVRGCGEGDVKGMLAKGNLGGKCADQNSLFVGLCRAAGIPARNLYGIRVAPSAFGYRELGAEPHRLTAAQHCRAEVYLRGYGWVAMDPADVSKVMRHETGRWLRATTDPVVAPVHKGLFGRCEGNWLAFNSMHDVVLPFARQPKLGFFMYPIAENAAGRLDQYAPETFRYRISAREVQA